MALKKESLKSRLNKNIWLFSFVVAGLLFLANVFLDRRADFSDFAARHMNKVVNTRFRQLESFSLGYRISEEKFFEPLRNVVDNLKLRASYGTLGNHL